MTLYSFSPSISARTNCRHTCSPYHAYTRVLAEEEVSDCRNLVQTYTLNILTLKCSSLQCNPVTFLTLTVFVRAASKSKRATSIW